MPHSLILHFVQNTKNIASSGQPEKDEFKHIARAGFKHVVNIAMHNSDGALATEGSIVSELGMNYYHLPVLFDNPDKEHLLLFIKLLKILEPDKIWVHCALNFRVSAFLYHYLQLYHGKNQDEARSEIFNFWHPDDKWQAILDLKLN